MQEPNVLLRTRASVSPEIAKIEPGFDVYTYDGKFGKVQEVLLGTEQEGGSYLAIKRGGLGPFFAKEWYVSTDLIQSVDPPVVTLRGHQDEVQAQMTEARPAPFRVGA